MLYKTTVKKNNNGHSGTSCTPASEIMLWSGKTNLLDAYLSVLEPPDARQNGSPDEDWTRKHHQQLNDMQWLQASLPVRNGGFGIRRLSTLALSAYLASAGSNAELVSAIWDMEELGDVHWDEMMEACKDLLHSVMEPIPIQQKIWDRHVIDSDKATIWSAYSDPLNQARLRALSAPTPETGSQPYL